MRESGLWHERLLAVLTGMRHTDTIVVADAGLPVPPTTAVIDLGWRRGEPPLLAVLQTMLEELVVERAVIAEEAGDSEFGQRVAKLLVGLPVEQISHEQLKRECASAVAVVRTGEATPYANVILHAGVPFGPDAAVTS